MEAEVSDFQISVSGRSLFYYECIVNQKMKLTFLETLLRTRYSL